VKTKKRKNKKTFIDRFYDILFDEI